jgi:hypothetical protein
LDAAQQGEVGRLAGQEAAPRLWTALTEQAQADGRGGNFAKGWMAEPNTGNTPGVTIRNTWPIAVYVEKDTQPHIIEARPGGVLAWMPGRGGFSAFAVSAKTKKSGGGHGWIFAQRVHHPGTTGKNVFGITMEDVGANIVFDALLAAARTVLGG